MHLLEGGLGELVANGGEVYRLAADHALGTSGLGENGDHAQLLPRRQPRRLCQHAESLREQGIANQDGRCLVVGLVAGGAAAAQVVVIHGGKIVVHQGVRVDEFEGGSGTVEQALVHAERCASGVGKQRAHPLTATEDAIPHGIVQSRWEGTRRRQQRFQNFFIVGHNSVAKSSKGFALGQISPPLHCWVGPELARQARFLLSVLLPSAGVRPVGRVPSLAGTR